jgi:dTDP-4-amino-4,6-dideoxygalactose transaminase
MTSDRIPFLDLNSLHNELEEEFVSVFRNIVKSGRFISGPQVEEFEKSFADFCGTSFAIGVGSGTDAVRFALIAAGVKQGDLVITVANTFIATTEAISQAGALPVFIDVDEKTSNMSSVLLREYLHKNCFIDDITGETIHTSTGKPLRAIVPVHLYGQMADIDEIVTIANEFKLVVIEDACQAHGAQYFSKKNNTWISAGSGGIAGAFSFYPGKNLGAFGEAGAVTTNDPKIAETIRMLRDHGQIKKYFHDIEGYNGRLDTLQAAILGIKLKYLPQWNLRRREHAQHYCSMLENVTGIISPHEPSWSKSIYHLFVIRTSCRDMFQGYLSEQNIDTALHYPVPLHMQKAYRSLGYKIGSLPVSEMLSREIVSLPMYPSLDKSQLERVAQCIIKFTKNYLPENRPV